jgi:Pyruvate/2-oxoacid:ferredoxin oxidoreductase delta subunit
MEKFDRKCWGEAYPFYVTQLEIDEETGDYIYDVQYYKECGTCFYIEECAVKVIKIVSEELWTKSDEYIIEGRTNPQ